MTQPPQDPQQPPWPPIPPGGPFGHQQSQHGPPPQQWPPNQQPWPAQPGPTSSNSAFKWALLGVALLAIIAVTAVAIVFITRDDGPDTAGGNPNNPNSSQDIASANDTGPVGIITADPTCESWMRLQNDTVTQLANWARRDASIPSSQWSPQARSMFESAADVFRAKSDQIVPLARQTPHRVMRELYEQQIAFGRAYADAIPSYTAEDDLLARISNAASAALNGICGSIRYLSAAGRNTSVPAVEPPSQLAPVSDVENPQMFLAEPNAICGEWVSVTDASEAAISPWASSTEVHNPAAQWPPPVRTRADAVAAGITTRADELEKLGRSSGNPIIEDFAVLSAQYFRAYVAALPTYTTADSYLLTVGRTAAGTVKGACQIVGAS